MLAVGLGVKARSLQEALVRIANACARTEHKNTGCADDPPIGSECLSKHLVRQQRSELLAGVGQPFTGRVQTKTGIWQLRQLSRQA